jgi:hypothetical protein
MIAPLFCGTGSASTGHIPMVGYTIYYLHKPFSITVEPILNFNVSVGIFKFFQKFEELPVNNFTVNR